MILAATNEQLGVMRLDEAIRRARSLGLDLVEIAPTAQPPVCRIVDFGKFRYDLSKQEKEKKHSVSKVKEVKFPIFTPRRPSVLSRRPGGSVNLGRRGLRS